MTTVVEAPGSQPLRALIGTVYIPASIYSIGAGAVTPIIAVSAHGLGASIPEAALIAGLPMVGTLVADVPSGVFVARIGERAGMVVAALVTFVASLAVVLLPNLVALAVASFVMGLAQSVFQLARHTMVAELVHPAFRARALSILAGTHRLGVTVGPFTTVALIGAFGTLAAYWVQVATSIVVVAYLLATRNPDFVADLPVDGHDHGSLGEMFRANVPVLARVGTGMAILMMLRTSQVIVVPLWGIAIGLCASTITLAVAISGLLQLVLFYTSGQIADRFGRLWVAIPVTSGLALGHLALIGAQETVPYFVVVIALGLANGIGSGIMMTLGSDLAPRGRSAEFLGLWRVVNDAGGAAAPFVISGGTLVASLGLSVFGLGVLGLAGTWMLWRWIPAYLDESLR